MPYGIQQPAVSAQILQLESQLGLSLFQRRPFCLTPSGDKLYRFIQPFFENLENVAEEIRGSSAELVRIGASDVILRDHMPETIQRLRAQFPSTKFVLRSGYQPDLMEWMRKGELDLALTLIEKNPPAGLRTKAIMELPLVLLVNRRNRIKRVEELWAQKRIGEPLLCLPPNELICRQFQDWLRARGLEWKPTIELSSLELIETYVENDYGFGLGFKIPRKSISRRIKLLDLPDFPAVELGLIWQGEPTGFIKAFMQEAQRRAHMLMGFTPVEEPPDRSPSPLAKNER